MACFKSVENKMIINFIFTHDIEFELTELNILLEIIIVGADVL